MKLLIAAFALSTALFAQLPDAYKQVGRLLWLVKDAAKTAETWEKAGVKRLGDPFEVEYHGSYGMMAMGSFTNVGVQWMQPEEGPLKTLLEKRGEGVYALVYDMPSKDAFYQEYERLKAAGAQVAHMEEIELDNGSIFYAIFRTSAEGKFALGITYDPTWKGPSKDAKLTVSQYAFVVRQPEKASAAWTKLGFPEITYSSGTVGDLEYRGKPGTYEMRLGWQRHGTIPFEWIQPLKGPSSYDEQIARYGEGFHHLGINVEDMDKAIAEWKALGYEVSMSGGWGEKGKPGSGRFAYFDTRAAGGIEIELLWNYKAR